MAENGVVGLPSMQSLIANAIAESIERQVAERVQKIREDLPKITAEVCARVSVDIQQMISYDRIGSNLVITIRNAYQEKNQ